MPTLLSVRELKFEFTDLTRRRPIVRPPAPPDRAPGAHQSDILTYCARIAKKLKPGERLEEDIPNRMFMGIMFEEMYFSMVTETVEWAPGEMIEDEIAVTCDGLGWLAELLEYQGNRYAMNEAYCKETKCTEKKVRTGEEFLDEWVWLHQGKAYCKVYGVRVVQWVVWFYRGDYRGSGPVCMEYTVLFSRNEIEATWSMLVKNRDDAMEALATERAA